MISDEYGKQLVKLARRSVEKYLDEASIINFQTLDELFPQEAGVFVSLHYLGSNKEEHLRGCIGSPTKKKLCESVIEAAIAAATQDPRFPPVDKKELAHMIFEVSVLSEPEKIKVRNPIEYRNHIKIGIDGLILKCKYGSGLLLPQVPIELNWDIEEYLANICYKAGAPPDTWLTPGPQLYKFEATVYKESEPHGTIARVHFNDNVF
jgi:uncharacterized protein (TIGR00296 family)